MEQTRLDGLQGNGSTPTSRPITTSTRKAYRNILLKVEHTRKVCEIMANWPQVKV